MQERQEQMELMVQWEKELAKLENNAVTLLADFWNGLTLGYSLTDIGWSELFLLSRQFNFHEILEAMKIAASSYIEITAANHEKSVQLAFSRIGGICQTRRQEKYTPHIKDMFYVRAILRNRFEYFNERRAMSLMTKLHRHENADVVFGILRDFTKSVTSWTIWEKEVATLVDSIEIQ